MITSKDHIIRLHVHFLQLNCTYFALVADPRHRLLNAGRVSGLLVPAAALRWRQRAASGVGCAPSFWVGSLASLLRAAALHGLAAGASFCARAVRLHLSLRV